MHASENASSEHSKMLSSAFSATYKYKGLLHSSKIKKLRNMISFLFVYMDSMVPSWYTLHAVISFWRLIQFFGPILCSNYADFYNRDQYIFKFLNIFSVIWNIVPVTYRDEVSFYIAVIYFAVFFLFFMLLVIASYYYQKRGKIGKAPIYVINIFISTVGYLFHFPAIEICSEVISKLIAKEPTHFSTPFNVVTIILTVITFALYCVFFRTLYSYSFLFRPTSFLCVNGFTQMLIIYSIALVAFLTGLNTYLPRIPQGIIEILSGFGVLTTFWTCGNTFSLVSFTHVTMFYTHGLFGCTAHIIFGILIFLKIKMSTATVLVFFVAFAIFSVVSFLITRRQINKNLILLDDINDDNSCLHEFSNPKALMKAAIIGFNYAHPVSIDFSLFKFITQQWPDEPSYWVTFGKFVAIYPEASSLHMFIVRTIDQKKFHGTLVKECLAQSMIIFQQREMNLTAELKRKIEKISKETGACKRRLRHIWDQVIQGNIGEMDSAISNAYESILKSDSQFALLLTQYPNNRFIFRSYSRYLYEVKNDAEGYTEVVEQTRKMSRGIQVHSDHAQELGLHAFPLLPVNAWNQADNANKNMMSDMSGSILMTSENEEEFNEQRLEDSRAIKELIDNLKIPSIRMVIVICLVVSILFFGGAIAMLSVAKIYSSSIRKPAELIDALAFSRYFVAMVPTLSEARILNDLKKWPTATKTLPLYACAAFKNYSDIAMQLSALIQLQNNESIIMAEFREYGRGTEQFDKVRKTIFTATIPYVTYNDGVATTANASLQSVLSDFSIQAASVAALHSATVTDAVLKAATFKDPYVNCLNVTDIITESIEHIVSYMYDDINNKNKIFMYCIYAVAALLLIVFIGIILISWSRLSNDKKAIYRTLMSLPKNVVSSINENLRQLQKNTDLGGTKTQQSEGERNKQEENLLKIFVTASDSSGTVGDFAQLAIAFVFIMICSVAYTTILFMLYEHIGTLIKENAPQANNMFGTASYISLLALTTNSVIARANGVELQQGETVANLTSRSNVLLQQMYDYYNKIRFGDGESLPFPHFESLATAAIKNAGCNITKPPANLSEVLACYSPDIIVRYLSPLMHRIIDPINATGGAINFSDRQDVFWHLAAYRLFDDFFYPGAQQIVPSLDEDINSEITFSAILTLIFIILILITIGIIIYKLHMIDKKLRFTLGLLLSCNPSTVMQNSQIVSILTGNFSKTSTDSATRDAQFYKLLVQDMQDSVIVTNQQFEIVSWNKASAAIFDVPLDNANFQQLLQSQEISGDVSALFDATSKSGKTELKYNHKGDTKVLNIQANSFGNNVVFTTQNVTQNFMYNKLIAEERAKSDTLLASILPASLVPRVQRGEKNISFAVPSASVVFIDIVEFTPWCGSNDAKTVMGTLNIIFQYFDAIVNSQQVMQRMKCIGDCYMAAGGIFAEVSNAVQNAKEAVDFGLQALDAIERVNKEQNQKLRIRVGVNVGGPLVAGVLGTEKPTFEIFGPVIVMAQQMEHNGVPMKVHISRAVYELIYGGQYKIEERGEIQIKQGKVVTYLVSR